MISSWASWPLNIWPIGCPEASVRDYQSALRNIPEERKYNLHRGGSLKSRKIVVHILPCWTWFKKPATITAVVLDGEECLCFSEAGFASVFWQIECPVIVTSSF
jgi:hypothetical protein